MPRLIHLQSAGNYCAVVDDDIYPYIKDFTWYRRFPYQMFSRVSAYRVNSIYPAKQTAISLHREVANFHGLRWLQILHHNGDGLDNRLENLTPKFSIAEVERRANAIREYQKNRAIREYWRVCNNI